MTNNLFKKSTKTLQFAISLPSSFDIQTLHNILNKYNISIDKTKKSADFLSLIISQNEKLDYKLYSTVFELYINKDPNYYLSSEIGGYPNYGMPFNPYVTDRHYKLKQQLVEVWTKIRQEYLEKM